LEEGRKLEYFWSQIRGWDEKIKEGGDMNGGAQLILPIEWNWAFWESISIIFNNN
jgi:hypothetical protein